MNDERKTPRRMFSGFEPGNGDLIFTDIEDVTGEHGSGMPEERDEAAEGADFSHSDGAEAVEEPDLHNFMKDVFTAEDEDVMKQVAALAASQEAAFAEARAAMREEPLEEAASAGAVEEPMLEAAPEPPPASVAAAAEPVLKTVSAPAPVRKAPVEPVLEPILEAAPEPPAPPVLRQEAAAVKPPKRAARREKPAVPAAPKSAALTVSFADDEVQEYMDEIPRGANIKVVGVGGAGCNAVNRMIQSGVRGVQFIAANTDCQSLRMSKADVKIQLGAKLTKGLGAGTDPDMGYRAAEEANDRLLSCLEGADMVFVTAGFGKGTGTGAAPYVAAMANQLGALTVAVICTPFEFEGVQKMETAHKGLERMRAVMNSVMVIIPNEKLCEIIGEDITAKDAFRAADDVLCQATRSISDLITQSGEVNLDFADVRTTLQDQGKAFMGVGEAEGADRAGEAVRKALHNPLLSNTNIQDAKAVLLNVTTGHDVKFHEIKQLAQMVRETVKNNRTPFNWGWVPLDEMEGRVRVTVIAAGLDEAAAVFPARRGLQNVATIDGRPLREHETVTPRSGALTPHHAAGDAAAPSYALHDELYDEPAFMRRQKAAPAGVPSPAVAPRRGIFSREKGTVKE